MTRLRWTTTAACALTVLAASAAVPASSADPSSSASSPSWTRAVPALTVETVASGLDIPWDIAWIDSTRFLVTERPGRLWLGSTEPGVTLQRVSAGFADLNLLAPGGLLGLTVDPRFATNRIFYTCQTHKAPNDVRVIRWRLSADRRSAVRVGAPVIAGIPFQHSHFGCRLLIMPDGRMLVGTGDGALPKAPQARDNLAGKILRVGLDGSVPKDNPWATSTGKRRFVWNYGHRNVQGLALRPGTNQVFNAEHGPDRDDEINLVLKGRNYGWNPVDPSGSGTYYQSVPMTDLVKYPNAVRAAWSSGFPTVATSGLGFVTGPAWGEYAGAAFVAELKGSGVMALTLDAAGAVVASAQVPELDDAYGRIRTVQQAPDGALYVLTSNGGRADVILRVTPVA
ncbi:MAG: PQQ-dependent sugar dehydrogenase [Actinobacteria bacterium]|nr:PQQ-dependent sugar dehydrogenase [Actinomycetota bacterium]